MSNYTLDRLEPGVFENIIQGLCFNLLGIECKIYGEGRDGQREALYDDDVETSFNGHTIKGRIIIQAKYKKPSTKQGDFEWLQSNLKEELENFKIKKATEPDYIPQYLLFFTNVILTPVKDDGVKDKIDKFVNKYISIIPNIIIIGKDEICSMLDNNREVATSYASFILSGDILIQLKELLDAKSNLSLEAINKYILREFSDDLLSRMEQAGMLTENRVPLEKVFIDLPASQGESSRDISSFASYIVSIANQCFRNFQPDDYDGLSNKYVLIGNAGQGKSTLCQFVAQIYRAFYLNHIHNNKSHKDILDFLSELKNEGNYSVNCFRLPIRIVLKDYASWIYKRSELGANYNLSTYIQYCIYQKTNLVIDELDFQKLIQSCSWLFIFDGLDEVSATSNRNVVLDEVNSFLNIDLFQQDCDAITICTTRPQGYTNEFSPKYFQHLYLSELDDNLCINYLNKIITNIENNLSKQSEYLETAKDALKDNMISRLMRTPLQATIIAILIKSGGDLPRDRYNLFTEYYATIVKRERQKKVTDALIENISWIDEIHYKLAYKLQRESEEKSNTSAFISKHDFFKLLENHLENYIDISVSSKHELEAKINSLYEAIIRRLAFATEIRDDKIGFYIRSMQEFFAANYITKNRIDEKVIKQINFLSYSSYWRNVLLFAFGYIYKDRNYLEPHIDSMCSVMNGSSVALDSIVANKISLYGSWLALEILIDGIFKANYRIENKYLLHASRLFELEPCEQLNMFGNLSCELSQKLIKSYIRPLLDSGSNSLSIWYVLGLFIRNNDEISSQIMEDYLVKQNNIEQILDIFIKLGVTNEFIVFQIYNRIKTTSYLKIPISYIRRISKSIKDNRNLKSIFILILFLNMREGRSIHIKMLSNFFDFEFDELQNTNIYRRYGQNCIEKQLSDTLSLEYRFFYPNNFERPIIDKAILFAKSNDISIMSAILELYSNPSSSSLKQFLLLYSEFNQDIQAAIQEFLKKSGVWTFHHVISLIDNDGLHSVISKCDEINFYDLWHKMEQDILEFLNYPEYQKKYKYLHVNDFAPSLLCGHNNLILNEAIDICDVNYEQISDYSSRFLNSLVFCTYIAAFDVISNSNANDPLIFQYCQYFCSIDMERKLDFISYPAAMIPIYLYVILNSAPKYVIETQQPYQVFEKAQIKSYPQRDDNSFKSITSKWMADTQFRKILDLVKLALAFENKEHNLLKSIPYCVLACNNITNIAFNATADILSIECSNSYNKLGQLIIGIIDKEYFCKNHTAITSKLLDICDQFQECFLFHYMLLLIKHLGYDSMQYEYLLCNMYSRLRYKPTEFSLIAKYQNLIKDMISNRQVNHEASPSLS